MARRKDRSMDNFGNVFSHSGNGAEREWVGNVYEHAKKVAAQYQARQDNIESMKVEYTSVKKSLYEENLRLDVLQTVVSSRGYDLSSEVCASKSIITLHNEKIQDLEEKLTLADPNFLETFKK